MYYDHNTCTYSDHGECIHDAHRELSTQWGVHNGGVYTTRARVGQEQVFSWLLRAACTSLEPT